MLFCDVLSVLRQGLAMIAISGKVPRVSRVCSDFFLKTGTKGYWPLDDLWPHVCWGHMCDSTQGSLCQSPMRIRQCMWIQWSILQNTIYYIHTYILYTYYVQNERSHTSLSAQSSGETKSAIIFICWTCKTKHLI